MAIGSDHGGFHLKQEICKLLAAEGIRYHDFGTYSPEACDYPDVARAVAEAVARGEYDRGIIACGTGIGVAMAANKVPGVRAALCHDTFSARMAREHNDANVLTLGERVVGAGLAADIVRTWLKAGFAGGRHSRRVAKITAMDQRATEGVSGPSLAEVDAEVFQAIVRERERQENRLELIASENFTTRAVMEAQGSVLTNKYAEGLPGRRYYGGCEYVDVVERLAVARLRQLFGAEHANVQPHSGTQANLAVYLALLQPGDTIMGMDLSHGGHLTHGSPANLSGKYYRFIPYGVDRDTGCLDYSAMEKIAEKHRPRLIVAGASAYPREIDFARIQEIARKVNAYLVVDMAHIAGLVAAGLHQSPVPCADVVTSTTHKTLRGPRGGFILCRERFAAAIDKAVFPGMQGGPLMHVIAAKAVAFKEALTPAFKEYQQRVVANARTLAAALVDYGFHLVSGGTDNHLILVDLRNKGLTGAEAEHLLEAVNVTVNKNAVPFDDQPPRVTSGIRLGTPAVTVRGMGEEAMRQIAAVIHKALDHRDDAAEQRQAREMVSELCRQYPLYGAATSRR